MSMTCDIPWCVGLVASPGDRYCVVHNKHPLYVPDSGDSDSEDDGDGDPGDEHGGSDFE